MSVLVRGMKMPENCWNCPFFHKSLHYIGDDELLERYTCLRTGERAENITGYMKKWHPGELDAFQRDAGVREERRRT